MKLKVLWEHRDLPANRELQDRIRQSKMIHMDRWKKFMVRLKKRIKQGDVRRMGRGLTGVVFSMPRRGSVVKTSQYPLPLNMLDSWLMFVDEIVRSSRTNPYLPVIHGVKFYQVKTGDKHDVFNYSEDDWEMVGDVDAYSDEDYYNYLVFYERLYSYRKPSEEQLSKIYEDLAGQPAPGRAEIGKELMLLLKRALEGRYEDIKDRDFVEACELVKRAADRGIGMVDMNMGNFMFRAVGDGYQLVITDPLM